MAAMQYPQAMGTMAQQQQPQPQPVATGQMAGTQMFDPQQGAMMGQQQGTQMMAPQGGMMGAPQGGMMGTQHGGFMGAQQGGMMGQQGGMMGGQGMAGMGMPVAGSQQLPAMQQQVAQQVPAVQQQPQQQPQQQVAPVAGQAGATDGGIAAALATLSHSQLSSLAGLLGSGGARAWVCVATLQPVY